jgi:hypothetical protein
VYTGTASLLQVPECGRWPWRPLDPSAFWVRVVIVNSFHSVQIPPSVALYFFPFIDFPLHKKPGVDDLHALLPFLKLFSFSSVSLRVGLSYHLVIWSIKCVSCFSTHKLPIFVSGFRPRWFCFPSTYAYQSHCYIIHLTCTYITATNQPSIHLFVLSSSLTV